MIITIDGPSGTGKSTVARHVAERLGFCFFDTGAMYRAFTWQVLESQIPLSDETRIQETLASFSFSATRNQGHTTYFVNGVNVTEAIRTTAVTNAVSAVAAIPDVRKVLSAWQRRVAKEGNCVFEGRDLGTAVFPQAEVKIFLHASLEIRAKRRWKQLVDTHIDTQLPSIEVILDALEERDQKDSNREIAPLRKPEDAFDIDTSFMEVADVVTAIVEYAKSKGA